MALPFVFNFKNPDYIQVFDWRIQQLNKIRRDPILLPKLKAHYRENIGDFITDWGCTADPRNAEINLPTVMPFVLFPRQEEWIHFTYENWKKREFCATAKSRDMGVSWLACAFATVLCLFNDGISVGFGSRKEEYVDKIGNPKSLFYKIRQFISLLPKEFRGSWNPKIHAPYMRVMFPDSGSVIVGEAGDNIGRGDRSTLYFIDEAAHLLRPELVEAALSNTTNCRHDISTPNGPHNSFAKKVMSGKIPYFPFHWTQDPRKDQEWYEKIKRIIDDDVIIAQEVDLDFNASVEGIIIPHEWVKAAVDAHIKLGFKPTGEKIGSLDVADKGGDLNADFEIHGVVVTAGETWSGRNLEAGLYDTTEKAINLATLNGYSTIIYDADGMGAAIRGDAFKINQEKKAKNPAYVEIEFIAFHGSGEVYEKDKYPFRQPGEPIVKGRDKTNEDMFYNAKAQGWYYLREHFRQTYLALKTFERYKIAKSIAEKENREFNEPPPVFDYTRLISISSVIPDYWGLVTELSQPTWSDNNTRGLLLVDKKPDGAKSPNRADAIMMAFAPRKIRRGILYV